MPSTLRLFVYGHLKIKGYGDTACVAGDLRVRDGNDAAAVFGDDAFKSSVQSGGCGLVWGQLLDESEQRLVGIDRLERPEYIRVLVRTMDHEPAWAFEYTGKEPFFSMPVCPNGEFPP